ncbi:hypothetical protein DFH08DRAFT_310734 [Mycena albidolilacea]|uniref:ZZ-type domain-containing protein n=1 Tax=Mycena albidolilacea TaxID=1033008 RepID=A0AAD6ZNG6_9AGAR|nr:hypothetical protein DFH08DRAFT_310734 [Mycena albidolilacea]
MAPGYFRCDACERPISSADPRIHCLDCSDHDLCAICALGERHTNDHLATHRICVFKTSGGGAQTPIPSSLVITSGGIQLTSVLPAAPTPIPNPQTISSGTSLSTISTPPPPPPLETSRPVPDLRAAASPPPVHPKRASIGPPLPVRPQRYPTASTLASVAVSAHTMPPRDADSPPPQERPQSQTQPASGWGPFFTDNMDPTPVFTQLLDAIFVYLDTGRTGYLVPEAYSRFLIDQGYVGQENTWQANLIATFGQTKEDVADAALKRAYDLFSIEYILHPRPRDPNAPVDALTRQIRSMPAYAQSILPASVSGGQMPLLTRKGFVDITAVEALCDPARHWGCFARVLRMYDVGQAVTGWGAIPRGVLPEAADPRMLARVASVQAFAGEQAKREVAANHAKLKLQAQGRANALDLIDDNRYYYRPI